MILAPPSRTSSALTWNAVNIWMTAEERRIAPCVWCNRLLGENTPTATCYKCHAPAHAACLTQHHMHDERCRNKLRQHHDEHVRGDIPYMKDTRILDRMKTRVKDRAVADTFETLHKPIIDILHGIRQAIIMDQLSTGYSAQPYRNARHGWKADTRCGHKHATQC